MKRKIPNISNMKDGISIEYFQKVHSKRKDSFWFDGQVASVSNGTISVSIEATGHKAVSFSESGKSYTNEAAVKQARRRKLYDQDIESLYERFQNANWFNLVVIDGDQTTSLERVISDLDDALAEARSFLCEIHKEFSFEEYFTLYHSRPTRNKADLERIQQMNHAVLSKTRTFIEELEKSEGASATCVQLWPLTPNYKNQGDDVEPGLRDQPIAEFFGKKRLENALRFQFSLLGVNAEKRKVESVA
jgi:hypothetical protein